MATNPYKQVGSQIQQLREALGLSQAALGAIALVSQQTVSRWERGYDAPDVVQARAIEQRVGKKVF